MEGLVGRSMGVVDPDIKKVFKLHKTLVEDELDEHTMTDLRQERDGQVPDLIILQDCEATFGT